jgi:hypothetical protein
MTQNGNHNGSDGDHGTVTIRTLTDADREAVQKLAQLDTQPLPAGRLIGAEVGGLLLAAASIESGELVADPFRHTDELRAMVELRAAQLRRANGARGRRFTLGLGRRPRAALPASPPGAGGRLLTLDRA